MTLDQSLACWAEWTLGWRKLGDKLIQRDQKEMVLKEGTQYQKQPTIRNARQWLRFISKGHEMVLLPPCTLKRLFSSLVLEAIKKLQFGFLLAKETMSAELTAFLSDLKYGFF